MASWEFWIDVGGTFTDCLARNPDGDEFSFKILSSGATKGNVESVISPNGFLDESRQEVAGFWNGAELRLFGTSGEQVFSTRIESFVPGRFETAEPLPQQTVVSYEIDAQRHAPVLAMHLAIGLPLRSRLPTLRMKLGTTRGTNALLTRTGARTAFVTSQGFRDLLHIGDQARPHLFELSVVKNPPLCHQSFEVRERVLADGTIDQAVDVEEVESLFAALREDGFEAVAICFVHAFRYPEQEQLVASIARKFDFADVSCSSDVAPVVKMLPRAETTTLDAYLNPVLQVYVQQIANQLTGESELELMTSAGGLVSQDQFSGKDSVLSGPAGGVVGAVRVAAQLGFENVIGFDMGGTSTDVCRFSGEFEIDYESVKAGVRLATPTLAIETVASGGGSVCWFDGTRLRVGPQSASADPGPACYGKGGPLTTTDVNLFLNRVVPKHFPIPLYREPVLARLESIRMDLESSRFSMTLDEIASGFLEIANSQMAAAIRSVSVTKGYDPQSFSLVSFGGAGSQHACSVADRLGIRTIIDHPQASVLSAIGIRLADRKAEVVRTLLAPLSEAAFDDAQAMFSELEQDAISQLNMTESDHNGLSLERRFCLRYLGTEPFLTISAETFSDLIETFEREHQRLYGYVQDRGIEIVALRVTSSLISERLEPTEVLAMDRRPKPKKVLDEFGSPAHGEVGRRAAASLFLLSDLREGDGVMGPAIVVDQFKTTIVDEGWQAVVLAGRQIVMTRTSTVGSEIVNDSTEFKNGPSQFASEVVGDEKVNPVRLELFNRQFSSIATQMGQSLQRTSCSVNVKERLDFSCAIFTFDGDLVVNAPHIPVHLGAMSETVRAIIRSNPVVVEADVYVTNNPFAGGSHLPDITVVQPVFFQGELRFWVASRSHHSELGGIAPGSMPAHAKNLAEEGVVIDNFKLVDQGKPRFDALKDLLVSGPYPTRSVEQNLSDIQAQIAANKKGEFELLKLVEAHGFSNVDQYMRFMSEAAEAKAREVVLNIPDGCYRFVDRMDNGQTIRVAMEVQGDALSIDFAGTSPVGPDNLNANKAIVQAAIMYVMRVLIDDDIPLNEGVMRPVSVRLPVCFLNPKPGADPASSPAVVGGNVETSQRIVDVLLGALGMCAASQGTMNNWLVGDTDFGYYETVGGGTGATHCHSGADAVHSHMTNTRLTDPEILETRYPMILREFAIRRGSGGAGAKPGGCGMIRSVEFRKPLTLSLLTNRRTRVPWGLNGGLPGSPGRNILSRGETQTELGCQTEVQVEKGDLLQMETPGGGGAG